MKPGSKPTNTGMAGLMQSQGSLLTLLALCAVASVCFPGFRTADNLANLFRHISLNGLVSLGMAFVILSGGIDLSVGSIAALAAVLAARLSGQFGPAAVLAAILAGICLGAGNGALITRMKVPPFIATLATMLGVRGLALILSGEQSVDFASPTWLSFLAKEDILEVPCRGFLFVVALGVAVLVAKYTSFGRSVHAIGGSEEAARMMGLNVDRDKMLVYMISGGCAAAAGTLLAAMLDSGHPRAAEGWELTAIAAVVIGGISLAGGTGKMSHVLYGVLILGVIPNIINKMATLKPSDTNVITGVLLLAVVLLQSQLSNNSRSVGDIR